MGARDRGRDLGGSPIAGDALAGAVRCGDPQDSRRARRHAPAKRRHRGGRDRTGRPPDRGVRQPRQGRHQAARWRHRLRDRLDHEGLHLAAARRRGPAWRGRAQRSGREVSAARGQNARARRPRDHASGSGDAHVRPAPDAGQLPAERPGESVRRLHRGADVSVPLTVPAHAGRRRNGRVLEPRRRAARPRAGAARGHGLRHPRPHARDRAAGDAAHRHRALARHAGAPRAGAQSGPGAGAELGSADVCRRRRAPIQRERHAHVPCRRARLRQLAARQRVRHDAGDSAFGLVAGDPASTVVNGGARHGARLAGLQGSRTRKSSGTTAAPAATARGSGTNPGRERASSC